MNYLLQVMSAHNVHLGYNCGDSELSAMET